LVRAAMAGMLAAVAVALPQWPIVGRRPELELFKQALGSGELAGLVIHGRAGVGKTRLADECARLAAASGHPTERVVGSARPRCCRWAR
jgi:ATP-dependent Clp protease ATP-binding subunit ClpA